MKSGFWVCVLERTDRNPLTQSGSLMRYHFSDKTRNSRSA